MVIAKHLFQLVRVEVSAQPAAITKVFFVPSSASYATQWDISSSHDHSMLMQALERLEGFFFFSSSKSYSRTHDAVTMRALGCST